jgi:hypothetical protein
LRKINWPALLDLFVTNMKRIALVALVFLPCFGGFGQDLEKQVKEIKTVSEANKFLKTHRRVRAEILEMSATDVTSDLDKKLVGKKTGAMMKEGGYLYKVLESSVIYSFRVSNVFLNGKVLSRNSIDSVRSTIISRYKNGTPFGDLVRIYNMDSNPTGDVGWFAEGVMVTEFEDAVRAHRKNDIFTVDIPAHEWYYVTLKTHDDRKVKLVTLLKVKMK